MNHANAILLLASLSLPMAVAAKQQQPTQPVSTGASSALPAASQPVTSGSGNTISFKQSPAEANPQAAKAVPIPPVPPQQSSTNQEVEGLRKKNAELSRKLSETQTALTAAENLNAANQQKIRQLTAEQAGTADAGKKLQSLITQNQIQLQQINDLKLQTTAAEKKFIGVQDEFNRYKATQLKTPDLAPENQALKAQVAKLQSELDALKQQSAAAVTQSQSSAKSVADLQSVNAELKSQIASLQSQNSVLHNTLKAEQTKSQNNPLIAENESLKVQLKQAQAQYTALQAKIQAKPTPEQDNQRGLEIFRYGDYDGALPYFRRAADADNPGGLTNLAMMYLNGYGVEPNMRQTEALLKRASDLGSAIASENLAKIYQNALGVGYNPAKAIYWYQIALKQGSTIAAEQLRLLGAKSG